MDRRVTKTKNAILNAYLMLALSKDMKKITVTEIARAADIDRKTFYLHYSAVSDIMTELIESKFLELTDILMEHGFYEDPAKVSIVFASLNELIAKDLDFYRKAAANVSYEEFFTRVEEHLYEEVLKSQTKDTERSADASWVSARFYAAGITSVYRKWLNDDHGLTLTDLEEAAAELSGD